MLVYSHKNEDDVTTSQFRVPDNILQTPLLRREFAVRDVIRVRINSS